MDLSLNIHNLLYDLQRLSSIRWSGFIDGQFPIIEWKIRVFECDVRVCNTMYGGTPMWFPCRILVCRYHSTCARTRLRSVPPVYFLCSWPHPPPHLHCPPHVVFRPLCFPGFLVLYHWTDGSELSCCFYDLCSSLYAHPVLFGVQPTCYLPSVFGVLWCSIFFLSGLNSEPTFLPCKNNPYSSYYGTVCSHSGRQ